MVSGEIPIECPNCGKQAKMIETEEEVPHFGHILISSLQCDSCQLKLNDVMSVNTRKPMESKVEVRNEKDLETKLVKGSTGTVKIPQLGVIVEPGGAAEGYITNLEGFLDRVVQAAKILADADYKEEEKNARKLANKELRKLQDAKKGLIPFTVIVKDPLGNSTLIGNNVEHRFLEKEEIEELSEKIESAEDQE